MTDDEVRLDRAVAGDTEALRTLLECYGRPVWVAVDREITAPWRSLFDADDVMQITYMEAFVHIGRLATRDIRAFTTWLHLLARNNLRDALRELQAKKRPSPERRVHAAPGQDSYSSLIQVLGTSSSTPSRQVAAQEAAAAIEAALECMPPDYARVIRRYDLEGRSCDEVAAELGRSRGAVHMLRARAHDLLRAILGKAAGFFTSSA